MVNAAFCVLLDVLKNELQALLGKHLFVIRRMILKHFAGNHQYLVPHFFVISAALRLPLAGQLTLVLVQSGLFQHKML